MNEKIHVLVVPTWYPIGYDKLMGVYHKDFTKALNKREDCKANILYIQRHRLKKPWEYLLDKKWKVITEDNYTSYIKTMLNVAPISFKLQLDNYVKTLDRAFQKYVKINGKPDVLHAMVTVPAGYAATKLGEKYNIPVVITEHSTNAMKNLFSREPYIKYAKYAIGNSLFTAVSKNIYSVMDEFCVKKEILPNLIDMSIFNDANPKKKNGRLDLVTVCALRTEKGIEVLIDALKILKDKYNVEKFHLNVVGDGEYAWFYKNHLKESGMEDYVTFVGRKSREEVASYISNSDFLVMPSFLESFGIPPIEAMACGVPVISTRCGAPEEYLDDKCGVLCNVKDSDDLARAIYEGYKKIGTYDVSYLKSVANSFSEKSVTDKAMKYYTELINR